MFSPRCGPTTSVWEDGEVNGRRMLRASAACEEPATWTKPQGATGGVPGVNGVGPLQGTHTHRYTLPFYFLGVLPSISALCAMSNSAKKKTTAMREVRAPQPGAAHQCRRLLFDWPLPRTHAHIFACRWLGACMPPPTPPAEVQQSPGVLLQQQNGPSVCFPNAGYRVISTCADPNRPVQRES